MTRLNHSERDKVKMYIKNGIDISDFIKDKDIKGEDLSRAIIKKFNFLDMDISNCNFAFAQLGEEGKINGIIRTKMQNCNFENAKFIGKVWVRSCDARNCNFKGANLASVDYQHSDFRHSSFCNAIIRIGTKAGLGCRFPTSMFKDLCQGWKLKITAVEI